VKKTVYVCQECGYKSSKWFGRCPNCGAWNSMVEEIVEKRQKKATSAKIEINPISEISLEDKNRVKTEIAELDRVLGGGIVQGSLILIGGEPGIGKSTLALAFSGTLAKKALKVLYISGEESVMQVKIRAERLKIGDISNLYLASITEIFRIINSIHQLKPDIVIIDSIQTIYDEEIESAPGSVSQVRLCANQLMRISKNYSISIIVIGHITKSGVIAGPRTLEHIVDTVLYLEGDNQHYFRILRSVKNRFGSTNEIGIFEMKEGGMTPVDNPSKFLIEGREEKTPGNVVVPSIEGSRAFLVEVQSLLSPSRFGIPQRVSTGIDYRRISMLVAVIEKRLKITIGAYDIFTNIAGGIKVSDPGVDLGVVSAMLSSFFNKYIEPTIAVIGEVGLSGEIRAVNMIQKRVKEAEKMGFQKIVMPAQKISHTKIQPIYVRNIKELKDYLF